MSTSTVQVETASVGDDVSMANMEAAQKHLEAQAAEADVEVEESTEKRSRTHVDSKPLPTDSMVTVPLSETGDKTAEDEQNPRESGPRPAIIVEERRASSRTNSAEIRNAFGRRSSQASMESPAPESPTISVRDTDAPVSPKADTKSRSNSNGSGKSQEVDWAELEKKEEQEPEGEEEVCVAFSKKKPPTVVCAHANKVK